MVAIDIPPMEAGAIVCTILFPAIRWIRGWRGWGEKAHILLLFLDLLRGAAFFPFLILLAGAFSNDILQHLTSGNRLTVFLAGVIGAVSVFKSDRWMIDYVKKTAPDDQFTNVSQFPGASSTIARGPETSHGTIPNQPAN